MLSLQMRLLIVVLVGVGLSVGVAAADGVPRAPLIAFETSSDLWVVSADGGSPHLVAQHIWTAFGASWSPDGRRLAVTITNVADDDLSDVYVVDADGRHLTRLTRGGHAENPSWSPAGDVLAFHWTKSRIDGPTWIDVARPDGSGRRKLTHPPFDGDVRWLPSGRELAVDAARHTFVVSVDTGRIDARFPTHVGAWSPDGVVVAFVVATSHRPPYRRLDLHIARIDGSTSKHFVLRGVSVFEPAWSPDGQSIAFSGTRVCNCAAAEEEAIFVVGRDGTRLRQITPFRALSQEPTWSPDGKTIAYVGSLSGRVAIGSLPGPLGIYLAGRDGTKRRLLLEDGDLDPLAPLSWQPANP